MADRLRPESDSSQPRPRAKKNQNVQPKFEEDAGPSTSSTVIDDSVPQDLGRQLPLPLENEETIETELEEVLRSRKTAFKQQELKAWKPSFNMGSLYWKFLILGLIYIPVGILLNLSSDSTMEIIVPYTDCDSLDHPGKTCADVIEASPGSKCRCEVEFDVAEDVHHGVYMYYALTNFYQNHRMYVKSKDENQMLGDIGTVGNLKTPSSDCEYYDYVSVTDSSGNSKRKTIIPCGAIANSLFNDSITMCRIKDTNICETVDLKRTGIAWDSDKQYKFKNPTHFNEPQHAIWDSFTHPKDWNRTIWDLDPANPENNGLQNEDLIVWMRTAALPNFRKPYRIIHQDNFPAGKYKLEIEYSYKTKSFKGTKSIVLCTQSPFIGSKNPVIGISFSVVGGVLIAVALVFLYIFVSTNRRRRLDLESSR